MDTDYHRKKRIERWVDDNAHLIAVELDDHDPSTVLLAFEKYLGECEEERMKA